MAHIIKQLTIFFCALAFSSHAIADVVIEAENANLSGVSIESGRGASDDAYVDFQNPNGDYIEFVVNVVNAVICCKQPTSSAAPTHGRYCLPSMARRLTTISSCRPPAHGKVGPQSSTRCRWIPARTLFA